MAAGEMSEAEFIAFLNSSLRLLVQYSTANSVHYICMDWRHVGELLSAGKQNYDKFLNLCVWVKDSESFPTYHSALYRRVESSSITPFSTRARDRGLHAVIVSLLRHTVTQLSSNPDAQNIEQHKADIAAVKAIILSRIESVCSEEGAASSKHVDDIISMWKRLASQSGLTYQARKNNNYLLVQAAPGQQDSDLHIPTLNSLRDVDSTSDLYLER